MDRVVVSRLLLSKKEDEANAARRLLTEAARSSQAERDAAVGVLVAALEKDESIVQRRARTAGWVFPTLLLSGSVGMFICLLSHDFSFMPILNLLFCSASLGNRLEQRAKRCSKIRGRIALALASHDNMRALGPLIEAYAESGKDSERRDVTEALTGLLPFVAFGHESLLNERQRAVLNIALGRWNPNRAVTTDEEVNGFIALVEVAARVGDKSAADALTALLAKGAKADDEWRLIRAAQAGLATLNERLEGATPITAGAPRFRAHP